MTKIIQFNPNYSKSTESRRTQHQTIQMKQQQPKDDTFKKMEAAFDAQVAAERARVAKPQTPKKELVNKAWILYDKALKTKDKVSSLIKEAKRIGYLDMINNKGNRITFAEDQLGRYVMTEYDKDDNERRHTTFIPDDNRICKIDTLPHTQIMFFNYGNDHIEIAKTTKTGLFKYSREVFAYENGRPISYSKYEQPLFSDDVLKEALDF